MALTIIGKVTTDNRGNVHIGENATRVTLAVGNAIMEFHRDGQGWFYMENNDGHVRPADISHRDLTRVLNAWAKNIGNFDVTNGWAKNIGNFDVTISTD